MTQIKQTLHYQLRTTVNEYVFRDVMTGNWNTNTPPLLRNALVEAAQDFKGVFTIVVID